MACEREESGLQLLNLTEEEMNPQRKRNQQVDGGVGGKEGIEGHDKS